MARIEKCFVIMPFSATVHSSGIQTSKAQWDHIYEKWVRRAVMAFKKTRFDCKRSPALPGNFVRGIISDLSDAYLVIADITGNKPNVFYELGIRHALRTGTILITQDIHGVPSDLKSYYTFEYSYTDKAHQYEESYQAFEKELHEKIEAFGKGQILSDSPVSDFLGFRSEMLQRSVEDSKFELRRLLEDAAQAFEENYSIFEFLYEAVINEKEIPLIRLPVIDTLPIDTLFSRIISGRWQHFDEELLSNLRSIVGHHRQSILMVKLWWDRFFSNPTSQESAALMTLLEHMVKSEMPNFRKSWPELIVSLDKVSLVFEVRDGRKKRQVLLPRPPKQTAKPND